MLMDKFTHLQNWLQMHSFDTSTQANFTSIGDSKTTDPNKKYLLPCQMNSIFLLPTTPEKILALFNGLDEKKSCGYVDIPVSREIPDLL